jgi:primary-amine oxidase
MAQEAPPVTATTPRHPLEALSAGEIERAIGILRDAGHVRDDTRFAAVVLHEPDKAELGDGSGAPAPERRAEAWLVHRGDGSSHTAVVSLDAGEVRSFDDAEGHHCILFDEFFDAIGIVKADEGWRAAMTARGVTDLDAVQCDPWPAGNFGDPEETGRRLCRVVSYERHFDADNGYAHPAEGLVATVDLTERRILTLVDEAPGPVPQQEANYSVEAVGQVRADLKPLDIVQPDGTSFTVDGNEIRWQKWSLRVSMHPTDGLVLHTVGYEDGGRVRPVLHRASLGEMVVPYGSTAPSHRWKNAFDAGELGLGRYPLLNSLELGCDCLGVIHYLDVVQAAEHGGAQVVPNAICIHEEDFGILWKHVDLETFGVEVRRNRRLVVSSIHTAGNYEYGFYWYLYQDGAIEMEVKLTGILQTQGVGADGDPGPHANLVGPGVAAPHHQHLFCFRLDFDVDGPANAVYEVEAEAVPSGPDNPYGNAFVARETLLGRESEAQRVTNAATSRHWRVVNPSVANGVGRPVGYKLLPGSTPTLLAAPDSAIGRRAAFTTRNLWVTAYSSDETAAAGLPHLHPGGAGLPAYAAADRPLDDTDVVVWYTFGVTHFARPEDWPVMPVERTGFRLEPVGFFDQNPALDVPPPGGNGHCHPDGA